MKNFFLALIALCSIELATAQNWYNISFESSEMEMVRSQSKDETFAIKINCDKKEYVDYAQLELDVLVAKEESTLSPEYYTFGFTKIGEGQLPDKGALYAYVVLKKDSLADRQRKIVLYLDVQKGKQKDKNNVGRIDTIVLTVKETTKTQDSLTEFAYLAYIGTNFDLVDGIKANHLFFASNIFLPPAKSRTFLGAYLSIYGNRTMTTTDSTANARRTYKQIRLTDSTYERHTEQATLAQTRVSDNLGAHISPLMRVFSRKNMQSQLQLYYAPSLEFVWRRTQITNRFSNGRNRDSSIVVGHNIGNMEFSEMSKQNGNEFSFNVGFLGVFLSHENKHISVRVHGSVGYSSNYYPSHWVALSTDTNIGNTREDDVFFSGRAWITEATTGITLQAEITNTLITPRPFYGVTLSKAIDFKHLDPYSSPLRRGERYSHVDFARY